MHSLIQAKLQGMRVIPYEIDPNYLFIAKSASYLFTIAQYNFILNLCMNKIGLPSLKHILASQTWVQKCLVSEL